MRNSIFKRMTLIEVMVFIAICVVVFGVVAQAVLGVKNAKEGRSSYSIGASGIIEVRCVEGYLFTFDQGGRARQVLDGFNHAARCTNTNHNHKFE